MNRLTRCLTPFAALAFTLPLHAQDSTVAIAYFVTTDPANVLELEEGMRGHVGWHASQNDTWPGFVFQAMTGGLEYVWVSPEHTWAQFDNPPVDPHADMVDFVERAGDHATAVDVRMWNNWADVSRAPAPEDTIPIWHVIEFDFTNTTEGREAIIDAFARTKDAFDQQGSPAQYTVNEVVSSDAGPELFVAIAHRSLSEMGVEAPSLPMLLAQAHGHAQATHIMRTFEKYLKNKATRFWMLRLDLSYMPGM